MRTLLRSGTAVGAVVLLLVPAPAAPAPVASAAVVPRSTAVARTAVPTASDAQVPVEGRFRWPLDGTPRPSRRFEPPPQPWLPGHRGVDLAAAPGAAVRSAGAGVVLFAGMVAGRPVITVGHTVGLRTTYEPVSARVHPGDRVTAGAPLGVLLTGHAGCPVAACLHWGLRRGGEYLDPLALLGLGRVRLLPLDVGPAGSATPDGGDPGPAQRWASSGGSRTARRSYSSAEL